MNEAFCVTGSEDGYLRLWPLDFIHNISIFQDQAYSYHKHVYERGVLRDGLGGWLPAPLASWFHSQHFYLSGPGIAITSICMNEAFCVTGSEDGYLHLWPLDFVCNVSFFQDLV